ncbi:hypothetical protein C4D60_Mb10t26320 [Musa balbisiana]|uniref:Clathrin/coatomer adaptor adaptin-like N-terminal domain-containing protein n=1 Tax=Musa balbisiana TaxID=52838 RepID=A0A4S8J1E7_MUSBA|nr:hypothetical protein C4D60_Mb10t26320 [Musa balbisiana]
MGPSAYWFMHGLDSDASIQKRALDLVFLLVNEINVKPLTKELIGYLEVSDQDFKGDLTAKICSIVDNVYWHIVTRYVGEPVDMDQIEKWRDEVGGRRKRQTDRVGGKMKKKEEQQRTRQRKRRSG